MFVYIDMEICACAGFRTDDELSWCKRKFKSAEFHRAVFLFSGVIEDASRPMRVLMFEGCGSCVSPPDVASIRMGKS